LLFLSFVVAARHEAREQDAPFIPQILRHRHHCLEKIGPPMELLHRGLLEANIDAFLDE
jgi:hypothetical protein